MGDHYGIRALYGEARALLDADSNGGTDIEIVAAKTGYAIVVDLVSVSASAAASFFFESGASTVVFPTHHLVANTSLQLADTSLFRTAGGEALTFSATITGNVSVFVKYHYEPATNAA